MIKRQSLELDRSISDAGGGGDATKITCGVNDHHLTWVHSVFGGMNKGQVPTPPLP